VGWSGRARCRPELAVHTRGPGRGHEPGSPDGQPGGLRSPDPPGKATARGAGDRGRRTWIKHHARHSEIISSHRDCKRVQDAYTLRCSPQVHGASLGRLRLCPTGCYETEMNASTGKSPDPSGIRRAFLLRRQFPRPARGPGAVTFMGMADGGAGQHLRAADRTAGEPPAFSGLPAFLVEDGGLNSGFHDCPVRGGRPGLGEQGD
jgi:hypothetical protein